MKGKSTKKVKVPLYKQCALCKMHSYYTLGGFYLCTMCGHKELPEKLNGEGQANDNLGI